MPRQSRFSKDGLHFFVTNAVHRKGDEQHPLGSCARVSCWINFRLYEGALALAKFYIKAEGWSVRSVDSHTWINGLEHAPRGTVRYYREALQGGASLVFRQSLVDEA